MAGTVWTEITVPHPSDDVWRLLLRCVAEVSDLDLTVHGRGTQHVLLEQTETMQAVAGDAPVPATIDHDRRAGSLDLSGLKDVPPGLHGELELLPAGPTSSVARVGVTTDAWWGGTAARIGKVGWVRRHVAGGTEQRMHDVVREIVALAVDADDETLRELLQHGTPTTQRLAGQRQARLAGEAAIA